MERTGEVDDSVAVALYGPPTGGALCADGPICRPRPIEIQGRPYAAIRRDHRAGMSMRTLQRKYGVTWQTVRKALDLVWPEPNKPPQSDATNIDPSQTDSPWSARPL